MTEIGFPITLKPKNLVEDNGFEPFAPGCKPGVLAKYTNPPKYVGLVLRYMVHRTSTVCQSLTIILYVIFSDWLVPKCSSKLEQHRTGGV